MLPRDTATRSTPLLDAMLLATTGGLLDAVVYLNYGHVFANAMTGNVVFLAIAAVSHNWYQIGRHLVPLCGFLIGVAASKLLRTHLGYTAIRLGLVFEILSLFALGFMPGTFSKIAFTAIIAFVGAFQVSSFRRVDHFAYNSTFLTGNLRDVAEGFYEAATPLSSSTTQEVGYEQARDLGFVCLSFLAGAIVGAWAAPNFANHALWLTEPLLLIVTLRSFRHSY